MQIKIAFQRYFGLFTKFWRELKRCLILKFGVCSLGRWQADALGGFGGRVFNKKARQLRGWRLSAILPREQIQNLINNHRLFKVATIYHNIFENASVKNKNLVILI